MPTFEIKAAVTVDVEMTVEAADAAHARKLFDDHICMTATLIDLPAADFDVSEDSISEVLYSSVEKV